MSKKILIVDDEPKILRFLGYALQAVGYEIITAQDGREALKSVQIDQPDLVILDVMLPTASGIDICQALRSRSETTTLPIIMFSARTQVADKIAGLKAGADEYLTKPISADELTVRVAALLERTDRLRQASPTKQAKTIGFIGAKGGVGTTSIVLNLASLFGNAQKRAIALELRGNYGTFSAALRLMPPQNLAGLLQLEPRKIDHRTMKQFIVKHQAGTELVFGPQKVNEYQPIEPEQAERIIDCLQGMADYLLIDLPPQTDPASQAALHRCDQVIVVVEPDIVCATSAKATVASLNAWGISGGITSVVVVNKQVLSMSLGELQTYLGCEIIGVVPPAIEGLQAAAAKGVPLVQIRPTNTASLQLKEISAVLGGEKVLSALA